ncbi:MAG: hypothetical protein WB779_15845, partial [Ignavibacteriaceae bacterium]
NLSGPNNNFNLPSNPAPIGGTYQYSGYDLDGNLQSSGTITIAIADTVISGQRDLNGDGFENGTGDISGVINDTKITIILTPNSIAHFILEGEFSNGGLSGDRLLDSGTSISVHNIGTFKAQKISY